MVKCLTVFLMIAFCSLFAASVNLPAKITVEIPATYSNDEITGRITIVHLDWQQIDEKSFTLEGKPLKVTKISENYPASKATIDKEALIVSKFQFTIPGRPRGLYLLPEISVKIGDTVAKSPQVTFEVIGAQVSEELQLDQRIVEKGPYYPGQKITFQYMISFRNPIQLVKEKLPLLEMKGFRTVGAPKIETLPQGSNTVQIISQKAVALEPGAYHSGISLIEGYVYGVDAFGNQVFSPTLIRAQTPDIEVKVLPFPEEGKPRSFNGSIGVFYWRIKPKGSTSVAAGERLTLEATVTGSGDFDTVNFPDLSRQKGFKDFRLSDIAPAGVIKENTKVFTVDIRPLVAGLTLLPAIEFSSFDPISQTYVIRQSDPITIAVRAAVKPEKVQPNLEGMPPPVWPIEIQGNLILDESSLKTRHLQTILLFYALLFLAAMLGVQHLFKKMVDENREKEGQSRDLILEAIKQKGNPDECCKLIAKALLLRLYEVGITKELVQHAEELPNEGIEGEIRSLLLSIEEKRFMGLETQVEIRQIIDEASQLYYRLN